MRLVRLGALFGSVVLLVATSVSMVNKRSELRGEQDARVVAAMLIAGQSVESTLLRAEALAETAGAESTPTEIVASFGDSAAACVVTESSERCTGADLLGMATFGVAAEQSVELGGRSVVVVDESSDSALVVSRSDSTVVIQLPIEALIGETASALMENYRAEVTVEPLAGALPSGGETDPTGADGKRVAINVVDVSDGGPIAVTASVSDDVGLVGDSLLLYAALLALGTVLVGLAGWTFLIDRRSLERRATTDELTGLLNRHEFERETVEVLQDASRTGAGACVMLIDLNGFKQINDTLGHQFGDLVLSAAAQRLRDAVRDTDVVGRWGGDEFVILLPGIEDGTAVRNSAERIGGRLSSTPIVGDVSISAAVGAALFPRHGATLDDLVRAADVAMYGAKSTGVTHRLADVMTTELAQEAQASASGYSGPDRRRVPVEHSDGG
jgi:diguanylate cyclase (GGDEF)-like protein